MSGIFTVVGGRALLTTTLPSPAYGDGGKVYDQSGALYVSDSAAVVSWANGCAFGSGGAMLIYDASLGMPPYVTYQNGLPFYQNRVCVDVLNPGSVVSGGTPFVPGGAVAAGAGGGGLSIASSFFAPLTTSLVPTIATGSPTFTRATPAYVADFEGVLRQAVSGEARFSGARRVQNLVLQSENFSSAAWGTPGANLISNTWVAPDGTLTGDTMIVPNNASPLLQQPISVNLIPYGTTFTISFWAKSSVSGSATNMRCTTNNNSAWNSGFSLQAALTPVAKRYCATGSVTSGGGSVIINIQFGGLDVAGNLDPTCIGNADLWGVQVEYVPGASNPAPSEYVSVGVLAAPWHGAGVDGVKYFATRNGNTARTNVLLYSQGFNQTPAWYNGATGLPLPVVAASSPAPDGTMTAWSLTAPSAGYSMVQNYNFPDSGTLYTFSIWVRTLSGTTQFRTPDGTDRILSPVWQRLSGQLPLSASGVQQIIFTFLTNGAIYEVWGAQLERGPVATAYIPTTTAPVTIFTEGSSMVAITPPPLGYLAEGQRTNLALQSQVFETTWSLGNVTVNANQITAPDGTVTADQILEFAGVGPHQIYQSQTLTATAHTVSFYAKYLGRQWIAARFDTAVAVYTWFDIQNGVVGTVGLGKTATISDAGNGWFRCTLTATATAVPWFLVVITATGNGVDPEVVPGDITKGFYLWGAQLEAAPFASSYIPTTTAAATRNGDVLTYPKAGNFADAAGSAYAEYAKPLTNDFSNPRVIGDSANGPGSPLFSSDSNGTGAYDNTTGIGTTVPVPVANAIGKGASAWGVNQRCVFNSGTVVSGAYDGSYDMANIAIGYGNTPWYGTIRNVRIYAAALSDAQLIGITS